MKSGPPSNDPDRKSADIEALIGGFLEKHPSLDAEDPFFAAVRSLHRRIETSDSLSRRLSEVSANAAELVAELEQKNAGIARANAHAAELVAEIEIKNAQIQSLNQSLSEANAHAAELVAENEIRTQELSESNACLGEAIEKKSKWVGFAAHDLRGGIGAIHGLASLLLEDFDASNKPDGGDGHPLELIREESARLLELLSALLEVTRIEQGRISLNKERLDLGKVTRGSIDLHLRAASSKCQRLVIGQESPDAWVVADPHRIRQVIDNLLSNAIKFSRLDTTISIEILKTGEEIIWSVTDSGPGLAEGDFCKLFHSFQKLSAAPTAGESSTGLGLAISRSIVELHLGRIWAENRADGQGARFSFALPLVGKMAGSYRVLIVDPDKESAASFCAALSRLGHIPSAVAGVAEVARISPDEQPDVVLADIHIPVRDIRCALSHCPPVVVISPRDEREEDREAADRDAFLLKPVDAGLLQAVLHRVLRLPDSHQPPR